MSALTLPVQATAPSGFDSGNSEEDSSHHRVTLAWSTRPQPDPVAIYLYTVLRYTSSLPPDFVYVDRPAVQGKFAPGVGGRAYIVRAIMVKKAAGRFIILALPPCDCILEAKIGTSDQVFGLCPDTGSSDTWVWSSGIPSFVTNGQGRHHAIYDPKQSSSYQPDGSIFEAEYEDSSQVGGYFGIDDLSIGGLRVEQQHIGLATYVSRELIPERNDGVLGLGLSSLKTKNTATFVEKLLASQKSNNAKVFTAYYDTPSTTYTPCGESFYTFGIIDQTILRTLNTKKENIHYASVKGDDFWEVSSVSWSVGGISEARPGNIAIIDTGSTYIFVEDYTCDRFYSTVVNSRFKDGLWYISDSVKDIDLPSLKFDIGGKEYTILSSHLRSPIQDGPQWVAGSLQRRSGMAQDVLGLPFLNSIYAIFDCGNKQFGAVQR